MSFLPTLCDRIARLSDILAALRNRVHTAVATETGRVAAEAVHDLVVAAVLRQSIGTPNESQHSDQPQSDPGPKAADPETNSTRDPEIVDHDAVARMASIESNQTRWAAAVALGVSLTRWLLNRHLPLWFCIGAGSLIAAAIVTKGPLVHVSLRSVVTAPDLIHLAKSLIG